MFKKLSFSKKQPQKNNTPPTIKKTQQKHMDTKNYIIPSKENTEKRLPGRG